MARRASTSTKQAPKTEATTPRPDEQTPADSRVTITGRLCAAPVLRHTASGRAVSTIRIAVNDGPEPQFHSVVVWGRTAETVCQYLAKGRLVQVAGRPNDRTWRDKDGAERHIVEINAFRVQFLNGRTREATATEQAS